MRSAILCVSVLAPAICAAAGAAHAQGNPDDLDCKAPKTQMAMNICASQAYQAADDELNATWRQLRERLGEGPQWQATLEAQRAWITFRDAHCESIALRYAGGSIQPLIRFDCLETTTRQRTAQLHDILLEP